VKLDTANTAIVLDSTADFPEAPQRFPNWRVVPLYVRFGDETYRDYVELEPEAFYRRLRDSAVPPATSQPPPGDFAVVYEALAEEYDRILSLQLSSTLSGTFASAEAAASSFGGVVRVIDTRTISAAIAILGFAIQRRLAVGTDDDEVDALVTRYRSSHGLLAALDTLDYLARGGRIGRAAAFAGTLLEVKPILQIADGEVVPLKRVRGSRKAVEELRTLFAARSAETATLRVAIAHAAAPERVRQLEATVRAARPQAQVELVTDLGPVVGTHAGPGALGLFWFDDPFAS
jgi:fatty acid kinase fatty acid binding subunit